MGISAWPNKEGEGKEPFSYRTGKKQIGQSEDRKVKDSVQAPWAVSPVLPVEDGEGAPSGQEFSTEEGSRELI